MEGERGGLEPPCGAVGVSGGLWGDGGAVGVSGCTVGWSSETLHGDRRIRVLGLLTGWSASLTWKRHTTKLMDASRIRTHLLPRWC